MTTKSIQERVEEFIKHEHSKQFKKHIDENNAGKIDMSDPMNREHWRGFRWGLKYGYLAGETAAREEWKQEREELSELVTNLVETVLELEQVSVVPLLPRGEKNPLNVYAELINRLKQEQERKG